MLLDVNVASAPLTPAAVVAESRVIPTMPVFLETSINSNPLKEAATKKTRKALECNGDLRARDIVGDPAVLGTLGASPTRNGECAEVYEDGPRVWKEAICVDRIANYIGMGWRGQSTGCGDQRRAQFRFHGSHPSERTAAAVTSIACTEFPRQSLVECLFWTNRLGSDPPPLKWSDLRYVSDIQEDCNGKEAIQA